MNRVIIWGRRFIWVLVVFRFREEVVGRSIEKSRYKIESKEFKSRCVWNRVGVIFFNKKKVLGI